MRVGLVTDPRYLRHETGAHPEQPDRLRAILEHLDKTQLTEELHLIRPEPAHRADIERVHDSALVDIIEMTRDQRPGHLDADTVHCPESADTALLAAGGVMTAVRDVMAGTVDRAMALVRPPGHHARPRFAMGFCLYNNVAVGARFLLDQYDIRRVAIIDFDVHHGNGTQEIFYQDPAVFFFSMHQGDFYPGTGHAHERGAGTGLGTTLNVPLPAGTPREEILAAHGKALGEVFAFQPEFVFISAGFDAHERDPLASMTLKSEDYFALTRQIVEGARSCGARGIVSTLEGGYNLAALAESVEQHLRALMME